MLVITVSVKIDKLQKIQFLVSYCLQRFNDVNPGLLVCFSLPALCGIDMCSHECMSYGCLNCGSLSGGSEFGHSASLFLHLCLNLWSLAPFISQLHQ